MASKKQDLNHSGIRIVCKVEAKLLCESLISNQLFVNAKVKRFSWYLKGYNMSEFFENKQLIIIII